MGIMDSTRLQRAKYVHRRAGSGGNETDTAQANTVVSEQPAKSLVATTSLPTTSSQETSQSDSATTTSSEVSTTSASSSSLPTSITVPSSTSLTLTSVSTPKVIPNTLSTSISISSARQFVGAPNTPIPSTSTSSSSAVAPNQPVQPVPATVVSPTSVSTQAPSSLTSVSPSSSASVSPSTSISTSVSVPESIQPPPSSSSAAGEVVPSSLLLDTSMQTASLTPISAPTFAPVSPTLSDAIANSIVPSNNAIQSPLPASTTSSLAPGLGGASTSSPQSGSSLNDSASGTTQGNNTTTIVGAAVGSVVALVLLALLGILCVRRRYRNTKMIISPFSRRQSGRDRVPMSPALNEDFRADAKMLFSKSSYSTFDEKDTAPSSRADSPPSRHSRSYTTNSLPPIIPARSVARPLSTNQQPPILPTPTTTLPQLYQPTESIDTSFMGTISAYFSSTPTIPEEPFDLTPNKPTSTTSSSIYTQTTSSTLQSPHASILPITPNLPTSNPPPKPSTSPLSQPPTSLRASSSALGPSRYQSMGAWRDSMWSTSATPIAPAHLPTGTAQGYSYFDTSRPTSAHRRGSRSLSDVIDWRTDTNASMSANTNAGTNTGINAGPPSNQTQQIGTAESLYTPTSAAFPRPATLAPLVVSPVSDGGLAIPPRSPLRAWPLRGN